MNYIKRIFKYVWPQWHRLVLIFSAAFVIAVCFSLSFVTIVPILKVMMGQEGLHGYVNRKICSNRHGLKFYVPDQTDFTDPNNAEIISFLQITEVKEDSSAEKAGLQKQFYIIGTSEAAPSATVDKIPYPVLLRELAYAKPETQIVIQYKHFNDPQIYTTTLAAGKKPFYLATAANVMNLLPKEQSKNPKVKTMFIIVVIVIILTVIRCFCLFVQKYFSAKITYTAIFNLRNKVFAHIIEMPISYFSKQNPSDAVSRLNGDINMMGIGINILLGKTLREPLKAAALVAGAMLLDFKLSLIFLLSAPPTLGAVALLGKKIKRATRKSLISASVMLGKLTEAFSAVKVIKVYNKYKYEGESYRRVNKAVFKQTMRISKVDAGTSPILEVFALFAGCAALMFGVNWVEKGDLDPTEFLTLVTLLGAAGESIRKSCDIWNKVQQANAAGERVYGLLDEPLEEEKPKAVNLSPLKHCVLFKDVFFTYPNASRPVLKGVNLTIEAGHNIALVGPNGSGKTTLVNLLPRFYDIDSGSISIDNTDIRDCTLQSLRNQMSLVTQQVLTFNDTIAANIAYGKIDATMDEIINASKSAYAHEFISKMPKAYDTIIGEQGLGLSGGQLQRIVIARAIIKDPQILIFDEATSQVDADSEAKIHKAIEELMHHRTSIIIAHRFSTVISADLIVVMSDGQIIAKGKHEQLMETCPLYQSLYQTQLIKA
ncbi:MAG: ABC transporter ATP-binding protein [Sedimentisphaerales bacterium]|nr:ABC transporter ATP-binding protein [Sedimentisphaerales bacterium]